MNESNHHKQSKSMSISRGRRASPTAPPRPRRTQEERRTATRRSLVRATIDILHEQGAAQFTTAAVAKRANLTRGAIQYHFKSPNDLLCAAIVQIADDLDEGLEPAELIKLPLPNRIDKVLDVFWKGFGSSSYVALLELAVHARFAPELQLAIAGALRELDGDRAKLWLAAFADTGHSRSRLLEWRASVLIAMRGLAITRMLRGDAATSRSQIRQFKAMFRRLLLD